MLAFSIPTPGHPGHTTTTHPLPHPQKNEALIRILRAGICNTDLEILKGYMNYTGILGHEFVGIVSSCPSAPQWEGKRVCGDINLACTECNVCSTDKGGIKMARNHCPKRTVLGILNKHGTMAECITLPVRNLHEVPECVSDEEAVFAEPLAAACRIVEQRLVTKDDEVAILGDGKLGLMIAEVVGRECRRRRREEEGRRRPVLFGKHEGKMALVEDSGVVCRNVATIKNSDDGSIVSEYANVFDVVVDATGSPEGLTLAASLCRPMGTLVLKSTCAAGERFNAAPFVIDELKVVGSRCGPIERALELLAIKEETKDGVKPLNVGKYVTKVFPLREAEEAIKCAARRDTMKVQIVCSER